MYLISADRDLAANAEHWHLSQTVKGSLYPKESEVHLKAGGYSSQNRADNGHP